MHRPQLPDEFLSSCTDEERNDVARWWTDLEHSNRSEIALLLDRRRDSRAYVFDSGNSKWQTIPIEHHHLESDDDPRDFEQERYNEWVQHVLDHPELTDNRDYSDFTVRTFVICTDHPTALETQACGFVSNDFCCPNARDCPIEHFAKPISFGILLTSSPSSPLTTWLCKPTNGTKTDLSSNTLNSNGRRRHSN